MSIGKRIPLVASIAFHTRCKKELSINEQAVGPPMRQNPLEPYQYMNRTSEEERVAAQRLLDTLKEMAKH